MSKSENIFNKACKILPGGVNSPVRAFKSVSGTPIFMESAKGCYLTDVDGNKYIDFIGSWGPMILGHAHPDVTSALITAVNKGTSFGTPSPAEVELAEEIIKRVPSVEKVRLVNSGTEATMSAIRLARAATKRNVIIKFAGGYHGHADSFLIQAGSGAVTFGVPDSPGVTEGTAKDTRIAEYNNLDSVIKHFENESDNIAAIIVEPVAGNMGTVPPVDGFLQGLWDICDKFDSILIFDEVMTGFRLSVGGAQVLYDIKPDLSTFGKVIGGGLPVGAYGGRNDLMSMIAPEGPVYQAGTLSGNPLAMAAGLQTLKHLDNDAYDKLERISGLLERGLKKEADKVGVPVSVQRVGSMVTVFFTDKPVSNMADAMACDHEKFKKFFTVMLKNGVHLPPSGYEAWFISTAHTEEVIEKTIIAAIKAFKAV